MKRDKTSVKRDKTSRDRDVTSVTASRAHALVPRACHAVTPVTKRCGERDNDSARCAASSSRSQSIDGMREGEWFSIEPWFSYDEQGRAWCAIRCNVGGRYRKVSFTPTEKRFAQGGDFFDLMKSARRSMLAIERHLQLQLGCAS